MRKGYISNEKTVWCGKCQHWEQRSEVQTFAKDMRELGWKLTRKFGWLCPECSEEISN